MAVYKEEKTNTWRVIYRYTDWTGEKKQTQKRGFKTKREAQAWEREQLHKATADLDMSFKSFVEQYTADMKTRIKENTWATKEHIIRTKLIPYFGKLKMSSITAQQIITWQNELMNYKDDNGKPALRNIPDLKIQTWLDCFSKLDMPFDEYYHHISQYTTQIKALYEQASAQSARWQAVVNEFNRRFRVPFEVQIENKANFLLKDEAPNLSFKYTRGVATQQSATLKKDDLMVSLSTGEKRALYAAYNYLKWTDLHGCKQ